MHQAGAQFNGHQPAGDRTVDIPNHQYGVGLLFEHHRFERFHDFRRLHGVAAGTNLEVDIRLGNAQLAEKQITHPLVIMLPRVDKNRFEMRIGSVSRHKWSDFHEIGTSAHDIQNFQDGDSPLAFRRLTPGLWFLFFPFVSQTDMLGRIGRIGQRAPFMMAERVRRIIWQSRKSDQFFT